MTKKPELPKLIGSYLPDNQDKPSKPGKQNKQGKPNKPSKPSKPDKPKTIKVTYIIEPDFADKLKALAYYNRVDLKDIVNDMVSKYLEKEFTQEVKKTWETK